MVSSTPTALCLTISCFMRMCTWCHQQSDENKKKKRERKKKTKGSPTTMRRGRCPADDESHDYARCMCPFEREESFDLHQWSCLKRWWKLHGKSWGVIWYVNLPSVIVLICTINLIGIPVVLYRTRWARQENWLINVGLCFLLFPYFILAGSRCCSQLRGQNKQLFVWSPTSAF